MKRIKSYIEYEFEGGEYYYSVRREVEDRNPLNIYDDGRSLGFRFYDEVATDNQLITNKTNYSNWVWFGDKYTYDDLIKMSNPKYQEIIESMETVDATAICILRNGKYQILDSNNIAYVDLENKDKIK